MTVDFLLSPMPLNFALAEILAQLFIYDQSSMRKHLLNCFLQDKLTPFPKEDVRVESSSEVDGTSEIKVCMKCSEWFHEKCLKIPKSVFSRKSSYNCPDCTGP